MIIIYYFVQKLNSSAESFLIKV